MTARPETAPLIVHVLYRFDVGGLENGVVNLINRLPRDKWRHAVLALDTVSETYCQRVERNDVTYVSLRKPPGHLVSLYPRLTRLLRDLRPAIVHTRNLAALEASVPAWMARVPARIHGEHGWDVHDKDGTNRRHRMARRVYRPFVHRYIALSEHIREYLQGKVGVPRGRISQIYNGVDDVRFRPVERGEGVADYPFAAPGLWTIGTVGRMQAIKDQVNLARAFVAACKASSQAREHLRLVMVGDGPQREEVRAILAQGGVAGLAWLPGERRDVAEILRCLQCYVSPSKAEGISNTILEAMATGLPVVATRVGGNPELVEDRLTGRLVPAENSEALAGAILEYLADPATGRRHGRAGRQVVERRFSLARMVAAYDAVYSQVLEANAPRLIPSAAS
jgi:sugar transferase (PEP-CTERM/EpsH1 system associated)